MRDISNPKKKINSEYKVHQIGDAWYANERGP